MMRSLTPSRSSGVMESTFFATSPKASPITFATSAVLPKKESYTTNRSVILVSFLYKIEAYKGILWRIDLIKVYWNGYWICLGYPSETIDAD
jgi:hypothetical protein